MKVLVTGRAIPQQPDRCTGQQLAEGFRKAGHEAIFYGCFYNRPYNFLGAKEAQGEDFDLVVITEMNDGMPGYESLFSYFRLKDVPKVYWDFDCSYHPNLSIVRAKSYCPDAYLVGNKYYLGKNGFGALGKPVLHLPYACLPQIHKKISDVEKNYLLGFVGSLTDERKRLITLAEGAAPNRAAIHHAEGVFGDDLVWQTNRYLVMFHNNQEACRGLVPGRPWEATACGTTLLMDRISYEDFTEFLPDHLRHEVFVYDNDTDIRRWLSEYHNRSATLELYGERLMKYVHDNHSYKNRAESIITWCKHEGII